MIRSPRLEKRGVRRGCRSAWARKAGVSPTLLSLILSGQKALTARVRSMLAMAIAVRESEVAELLASTRRTP